MARQNSTTIVGAVDQLREVVDSKKIVEQRFQKYLQSKDISNRIYLNKQKLSTNLQAI